MTLENLICGYVPDAEEKLKDMTDDINYIEKFLNERQLELPEAYGLPFANHVVMMVERIRNNECINMESTSDEIQPETVAVAEEMLQPLFQKYQIEKNESEIKLMAIYLTLMSENRKEIENYG